MSCEQAVTQTHITQHKLGSLEGQTQQCNAARALLGLHGELQASRVISCSRLMARRYIRTSSSKVALPAGAGGQNERWQCRRAWLVWRGKVARSPA